MKKRVLAALVIVIFAIPSPAMAQSLRASADRKASELALQNTNAASNPYKTPAIALMAGGAGLLLIGLMQERGVRTEGDIFGGNIAVKETGGSKTALVVLGTVAAASGAGLWFWGENKKGGRADAALTPTGLRLRVRF